MWYLVYIILSSLYLTAYSTRIPSKSLYFYPEFSGYNGHLRIKGHSLVDFPSRLKLRLPWRDLTSGHVRHITLNLVHHEGFTFPVILSGKGNATRHFMSDAKSSSNCHYKGSVEGDPTFHAIISLCKGLRGTIRSEFLVGTIDAADSFPSHTKQHIISLKPSSQPTDLADNDSMPHLMKKIAKLRRKKRDVRLNHYRDTDPYVLELYIFMDRSIVVDAYNNDRTKLLQVLRDSFIEVNMAYLEFNIVIAIVACDMRLDSILDEDDVRERMLKVVKKYNYNHKYKLNIRYDCVIAILPPTRKPNTYRGLADGGSVCSSTQCAAFVRHYHKRPYIYLARALAHELGHTFNLRHDSEECKCQDCIMAAGIEFSDVTMKWSNCSISDMNWVLEGGYINCLRDTPKNMTTYMFERSGVYGKPTRIRPSAICGNGVVEDGEECDCGTEAKCPASMKKCCEPSRCKLRNGASCGGGACCDLSSCTPKSSGVVCRPVKGECDLAEYCNGTSEWCPQNFHKLDGVPCTTAAKESSRCSEGMCRARESWCRVIYGSSGRLTPDCFAYNMNAEYLANCGNIRETDYGEYKRSLWPGKQCSSSEPEDKCGRLWCSHGNERTMLLAKWIQVIKRSSDERGFCQAVLFDPVGLYDPGLVPNGVPCGSGNVCWNATCVPPSKLNIPNRCTCNNAGVCNNNKNCHCKYGYAPPNCTTTGTGGSVDSGGAPQRNLRKNATLIFAIVIGILLLMGLITIGLWAMYKKRSQEGDNKLIPTCFSRIRKISNRAPTEVEPSKQSRPLVRPHISDPVLENSFSPQKSSLYRNYSGSLNQSASRSPPLHLPKPVPSTKPSTQANKSKISKDIPNSPKKSPAVPTPPAKPEPPKKTASAFQFWKNPTSEPDTSKKASTAAIKPPKKPAAGPDPPKKPSSGPETPKKPSAGPETPKKPSAGPETPKKPGAFLKKVVPPKREVEPPPTVKRPQISLPKLEETSCTVPVEDLPQSNYSMVSNLRHFQPDKNDPTKAPTSRPSVPPKPLKPPKPSSSNDTRR